MRELQPDDDLGDPQYWRDCGYPEGIAQQNAAIARGESDGCCVVIDDQDASGMDEMPPVSSPAAPR